MVDPILLARILVCYDRRPDPVLPTAASPTRFTILHIGHRLALLLLMLQKGSHGGFERLNVAGLVGVPVLPRKFGIEEV